MNYHPTTERRTLFEQLEPRLLLSGTNYVVTSLADIVADDGMVTLREALEAANTNTAVTADVLAGSDTDSDLIMFNASALQAEAGAGNPLTIILNGSELTISDDVNILGLGDDVLTIDANGTSRVIGIDGAADVLMSGLTVTGGLTSGHGGGLHNPEGTLTLYNVNVTGNSAGLGGGGIFSSGEMTILNGSVTGNSADQGGGISSFDGDMTLTGVTISSNTATRRDGGGIYKENGDITLSYVTISDNRAEDSGGGIFNDNFGKFIMTDVLITNNSAEDDGGGIYNDFSTLHLTRTIVSDNEAGEYGGGIYNWGGNSTLTNVTVSSNSAAQHGGGIYNDDGAVKLTNSTVIDNTAEDGGGIYNSDGEMTTTNVTVSGNTAKFGGGGFFITDSELILTGLTVSGNSASKAGGGIYSVGSTLMLTNMLASGNTAEYGGGISIANGETTILNSTVVSNTAIERGGGLWSNSSATLTLSNSIVALNDAAEDSNDIAGVFIGSENLIGIAPGFVDAAGGDYRLSSTSIAINAGDASLLLAIEFDLAGNDRISDGAIDLGAYEYQGAPDESREAPSAIVTTLADTTDSTDGLTSLREALAHVMLGNVDSTVTFGPALAGGTVVLGGRELILYETVTVDGGFAGVTIDADRASRVMSINGSDVQVQLNGLTLTGGYTIFKGGAISNRATVSLTNSSVRGNTAEYGGGIYNYGDITLLNTTVIGNTAIDGGGIFRSSGTMTIVNSTITGNTAADKAGGIFSSSNPTLTLNNTIVALNKAGTYPYDIFVYWAGSNNLIGVDPQFVRNPSAGDDKVWGTTDDDYGDLRLRRLVSPAIDAGSNALAVDADGNPLTTDIAGNPRIMGLAVDIGAYEYHPGAADIDLMAAVIASGFYLTSQDLNDSGAVDQADMDLLIHYVLGTEYGDANLDGKVTLADLTIVSTNFGITSGAAWSQGDFNGDGAVSLADMTILATNFGFDGTAAPAGSSEPVTASLQAEPEQTTVALTEPDQTEEPVEPVATEAVAPAVAEPETTSPAHPSAMAGYWQSQRSQRHNSQSSALQLLSSRQQNQWLSDDSAEDDEIDLLMAPEISII